MPVTDRAAIDPDTWHSEGAGPEGGGRGAGGGGAGGGRDTGSTAREVTLLPPSRVTVSHGPSLQYQGYHYEVFWTGTSLLYLVDAPFLSCRCLSH